MRARGFSSWVISSVSRVSLDLYPEGWSGEGEVEASEVTVISLSPRRVWFRRRAVLAAVSFSKVTVADLREEGVEGVTVMEVILPLGGEG